MTEKKWAERSAIFSRFFGVNISRARDRVATWLIKLHISPNTLTICGLLVTIAAAGFLTAGAGDAPGNGGGKSWWGVIAALILIGASAFDMLDGAVARIRGQMTRRGAFLDSCCDRLADGAIFLGIMTYYLRHPEAHNSQLFAILSIITLINAQCISYVKARAENFIESCPVGYWQRGERMVAILLGLFSGHIATVMILLAISSSFTVLRRMVFGYRQIHRSEQNQPLANPKARATGIYRLALWRYRRGSLPYDLITAANICFILFVDLQQNPCIAFITQKL